MRAQSVKKTTNSQGVMRARAAGRPQLLNYSLVSVYSRIQFGRALYPTERKGDNRYPAARYRMEEEVALAVHIPWSWLASRGNRSVAAFDKMPHLGGLISLRWTDGRTDGALPFCCCAWTAWVGHKLSYSVSQSNQVLWLLSSQPMDFFWGTKNSCTYEDKVE